MPTAVAAYVYAGGFSVGVRRAGFEVLAHLEGDNAYGVADARANWPELPIYHGPTRWPLDELRERNVDFAYANPPCFTADTRVITADGPRSIKELVRERSTTDVMSIDSNGKRVFRPITGWHENDYSGDLYDVALHGRKLRARATAEHRFMTRRGWVAAAELTVDDEVCIGSDCPNIRQRELITGLMLGDSQIKRKQAQLYVYQATPEYVELKRRALSDFVCQEIHESVGTQCGEYTRKPRHGFYLKTQRWVETERDRWYAPDRSRRIPRDIELTPMTLAVWYMDDGVLRGVSGATRITPKRPNGERGGMVHLCTDRLPRVEVDFLIDKLCSIGIEARIAGGDSERAVKYPRIAITVGFKKFIEMIGPYVPPEMRYKLPSWAPDFDEKLWNLGNPDVYWSRIDVRLVPRTYKKKITVYCLDVDETHNFVTHGGVVHNCAVFSAMGIVTTRGEDGCRTDPRLAHWWDSFNVLERVRPRAWCLESVTQAYGRGRSVVDEMTLRALALGYSVTHLLLDAKWTGLPQSRKRFFIVAHRPARLIGYRFNFAPSPTVGEVLAEIPEPGWSRRVHPPLAEALRHTPQGGKVCRAWESLHPGFENNLNERGHVAGRPSFQDTRLDPTKLMGAFVGDKFYHPVEHRMIGIEEAKALCGYPREFRLTGNPSGWHSMLARAVMPPVGAWLARSIEETLAQEDADWDARRVTLVDVRTPGIEPVDLTDRYLGSEAAQARSEHVSVPSGYVGIEREVTVIESVPKVDLSYGEFYFDESPDVVVNGTGDWLVYVLDGDGYAIVGGDVVAAEVRQDSGDGEDADGLPEEAPASDDRSGDGDGRDDNREAGGRGRSPAADATETVDEKLTQSAVVKAVGEGSGKFMQRLWKTTDLSVDDILAAVHANYTGRTTGRSDVYYNYRKLVDSGETVRLWPGKGSERARSRHPGGESRTAVVTPPSPPAVEFQGAATDSETAKGPTAWARAPDTAPAPAVTAPVSSSARLGQTFRKIAVVDWFPRVCGATDSGPHLAYGDDRYELVSVTRSGHPLMAWNTPWEWRVLRMADASSILNSEYDAVILTDIACLAPELSKGDEMPWYTDILRHIRVPTTAIFHGGMAYRPKYDPMIDALFRSPGFTGSILTAREGQARERLNRWPDLKFVVNPFYAYREDRAEGARRPDAERRRAVMMTQRLATNKGQNALLAMIDRLDGDAEVWGYNSFGLPSIGWRLYELGQALGYRADAVPGLRADVNARHPNAPRFYTGKFAFTAPNGRRFSYHDGYSKLSDVDWSPWVHLSLFSPDFHGLLEFAILDAVHAGAIAVVPERTVPPEWYDGTLVTVPFAGTTLWAKKDTGVVGGRDFDRDAVAGVINGLLAKSDAELTELQARQSASIRQRHDPAAMRATVEVALRGDGE